MTERIALQTTKWHQNNQQRIPNRLVFLSFYSAQTAEPNLGPKDNIVETTEKSRQDRDYIFPRLKYAYSMEERFCSMHTGSSDLSSALVCTYHKVNQPSRVSALLVNPKATTIFQAPKQRLPVCVISRQAWREHLVSNRWVGDPNQRKKLRTVMENTLPPMAVGVSPITGACSIS